MHLTYDLDIQFKIIAKNLQRHSVGEVLVRLGEEDMPRSRTDERTADKTDHHKVHAEPSPNKFVIQEDAVFCRLQKEKISGIKRDYLAIFNLRYIKRSDNKRNFQIFFLYQSKRLYFI